VTKTTGLFLLYGCVQLNWAKLGIINYDNEGPICEICTIVDVTFSVRWRHAVPEV